MPDGVATVVREVFLVENGNDLVGSFWTLALELRSATTSARLLLENGQREQARQVLSPVYNGFTEGFETADLKIARQLIEDLA